VTAEFAINEYTVTFKDHDGTELKTQKVEHGRAATAPTAPTRTGYTFTGWDKEFTNITGDLTVTAQYTINEYAVTFSAGANGSLTAEVGEESITSGANVEHFKKVIFTATPSTGYQVKEWKVDGSAIEETGLTYTIASLEDAVEVTVEFEKISYTLTYTAGENGSITGDSPQSVKYGENGSEVTAVPNDGYHFVKWSDDVETAERTDTNVTADITVTAEFAINEYTVTFKDHDGTELKTQKVEHGRAATAPTAPTRTGYTFTGWDKEFTNITGDLTVTAQYTINEYAVTFSAGANGSLTAEVGEESITSGANVEHFKKVIFTATPSTGYQVKEWKVDGSAIEETGLTYTIASLEDAVEVTVEFEKISYTLTYTAGENGSITGDSPQSVKYGENGSEVTAVPNDGYHFVKWSDDVETAERTDTNVTADITVTAEFAINEYTVTFKDHDGTELKTQKVEHGRAATAPTAPTRTGYTFTGWDKEFTNITGDLTVTAQYTINEYAVTFSAGANGSLTAEVGEESITSGANVEHFKKVIFTATPSTGYQVKEWKVDGSAIEETGLTYTIASLEDAVEVTVEFEKISYTLTYTAGENGSITGDSPQSVKYGENGSEVTAVPNDGYHFVKWSDDVETAERTDTNVTADITVTAEFAINEYTVTFKDHDGTELKTQKVEHGRAATAPTAPTRTGYTFTGWDKEFTNITGDLTVTAQYTINEYAVTFSAGANGSLTAEVGEESITSGANVEHFKKVIFTAAPSTGYQVEAPSTGYQVKN
jgi:ribosome-associated toxin RatA of RatAB toxin-antitoxin module